MPTARSNTSCAVLRRVRICRWLSACRSFLARARSCCAWIAANPLVQGLVRTASFPLLLACGAVAGAALGAVLMTLPSLPSAVTKWTAAIGTWLSHVCVGSVSADLRVLWSMLLPLPAAAASFGLATVSTAADLLMQAGVGAIKLVQAIASACVAAIGLLLGAVAFAGSFVAAARDGDLRQR